MMRKERALMDRKVLIYSGSIAKYQCVELCKRYIEKHYGYNTSGNAIEWPAKRAKEPDKYIVFANDGTRKVREGDLIVWNYGVYGHIGVVIKTTPKYISDLDRNSQKFINDYSTPQYQVNVDTLDCKSSYLAISLLGLLLFVL